MGSDLQILPNNAAPARSTTSIDDELTLRCWSGQRPRAAAREMDIPLRRFLARRRRLEIPALPLEMLAETFDPALAEGNIKAMRYRLQQCAAYKLHGIAFFFWRPINDVRRFSQHSRSAPRLAAFWQQTNGRSAPSDTEV